MDGFPIELQDGESGHLNEKWLDAVFESLERKLGNIPVFVISVIGVQSAGKSTLLNTMFGTSFRCGDGMCTRGINMQLVPSKYSKYYSYVLARLSMKTCSQIVFLMVPQFIIDLMKAQNSSRYRGSTSSRISVY